MLTPHPLSPLPKWDPSDLSCLGDLGQLQGLQRRGDFPALPWRGSCLAPLIWLLLKTQRAPVPLSKARARF